MEGRPWGGSERVVKKLGATRNDASDLPTGESQPTNHATVPLLPNVRRSWCYIRLEHNKMRRCYNHRGLSSGANLMPTVTQISVEPNAWVQPVMGARRSIGKFVLCF